MTVKFVTKQLYINFKKYILKSIYLYLGVGWLFCFYFKDRPLIVEERREYVSIVVWPLKYNLFIALVKETLYKCIIEIKVGIHN